MVNRISGLAWPGRFLILAMVFTPGVSFATVYDATSPDVTFSGSWTSYGGWGGQGGVIKYAGPPASGNSASVTFSVGASDGGYFTVKVKSVTPSGETADYATIVKCQAVSTYGGLSTSLTDRRSQAAGGGWFTCGTINAGNSASITVTLSCDQNKKFMFDAIEIVRGGDVDGDEDGDGVPDDEEEGAPPLTPTTIPGYSTYSDKYGVAAEPYLVGTHVWFQTNSPFGHYYYADGDSGEVDKVWGHIQSIDPQPGYWQVNIYWYALGATPAGVSRYWYGEVGVRVGRNGFMQVGRDARDIYGTVYSLQPLGYNGSTFTNNGEGLRDGWLVIRPVIKQILSDPRGILSSGYLIPVGVRSGPRAGYLYSIEKANPAAGAQVRAMLMEIEAGLVELKDYRELIPRTADQQFDDMGGDGIGGSGSGGGTAPTRSFSSRPEWSLSRSELDPPAIPSAISRFWDWIPSEIGTRDLTWSQEIGLPGVLSATIPIGLYDISDDPTVGYWWDFGKATFRTLLGYAMGGWFLSAVWKRLRTRS